MCLPKGKAPQRPSRRPLATRRRSVLLHRKILEDGHGFLKMNDFPEEFQFEPFPVDTVYELRISGRLGQATQTWFEDMTVAVDESTTPVQTIILGPMRDEAALYGLISRIRDLGLTLLSVNQVAEE